MRRRSSAPHVDGYGYAEWSHRGLSLLHVLPWLWPWTLCGAVYLFGVLLHLVLGRDPAVAPWAAVATTLAVLGLTAITYAAGRARGPLIRRIATGAVSGGGLWLLFALLLAPWQHAVWIAYVFTAVPLAIASNILRLMRGQGQDGASGWDDLAAAIKLPGSRAIGAKRKGSHTVTATIQAGAGQTQEDISAATHRIAAVMGAPVNGARVTPDPDHAGRATLTLVTRDLLRNPIPWAGLSAPGSSIIDPIRVGVRESGNPLQLYLPADEKRGRSAQHVIVTGQTGSGKSVFGRLFLAEVLSRTDVEVWLIDLVKGRQFTGPFVDRVARLGVSEAEARQMVGALPGLIAGRADELGGRGLDNWVPGCGLPYLVVHIEEAATAIAKSREIVTAMQTGRSTGTSIVLSQQRVAHTAMPVDARQQAGTIFQFGCKRGDEKFALSPATLDAGAMPQAWGNSRPGMVYAETPGNDPTEWPAPARVEFATAPEVAAALGGPAGLTATMELPREVEPAEPLAFRADEARERLRSAILKLRDAGHDAVRPRDLDDVRVLLGRSEPWLNLELGRLVSDGVLAKASHGVYEVVA